MIEIRIAASPGTHRGWEACSNITVIYHHPPLIREGLLKTKQKKETRVLCVAAGEAPDGYKIFILFIKQHIIRRFNKRMLQFYWFTVNKMLRLVCCARPS